MRAPTEPRVGQLKISGVLSSEPTGKPLRECARGECYVTYDAGEEDEETRRRHGVIGLRRYKVLRIATEAHDQGIDLTQEALAKILGAGVKTIKRDIAYFREHGIFLPTRGQQKDLGPIVPHQVEAIRLTLDGLSDWEVSRKVLHSPGVIDRIRGTFGRVIALLREGRDDEEIVYLAGVPRRLLTEYRRLATAAAGDPARLERLEALLPKRADASEAAAAMLGRDGRAGAAGRHAGPPIFDEQVKVLRRDVFDYVLDLEVRRATRYKLPLALLAVEPDGPDGLLWSGRALASKVLSETLRQRLRATDIIGRAAVARYRVLLPIADRSATRGVMERLLLAGPASGGIWFVAGAACFPAHGTNPAELVAESERALAGARARGRPYLLACEVGDPAPGNTAPAAPPSTAAASGA